MFKVYKIGLSLWVVGCDDPQVQFPEDLLCFDNDLDAEEAATFLEDIYNRGRLSVQAPIRAALGPDHVGN